MFNKNIFLGLVSLCFLGVVSTANADGCLPKNAGAHEQFCAGLSAFACKAHSSVCKSADSESAKVIVIQKSEKCVAQDGKEAHEGFCNGHDKQICKVHSSLCEWK